jgi:hypothetical protein
VTDADHDESAADTLRRFVYGDAPMEEWVTQGAGTAGAPWDAFERARRRAEAGESPAAADIWHEIALSDGLESRQTLQAWKFLSDAGYGPAPDRAKTVLGAIMEMPVEDGHDLLAAYADGSARYLNYSGKVALVEDRSLLEIQAAIHRWIEVGEVFVQAMGAWDHPELPPLLPGQMRIMVLTPSGPHFGQGPAENVSTDQRAMPFIDAATTLVQLIFDLVAS